MTEESETPEYIPLAMLNAYAYCPRRFYYEFTLAEMVVNEHVLEGQQLHERVDLHGSDTREGKMQLRRVYLCATTLGLLGYCDVVEIETTEEEEEKKSLSALALEGKLYPVEYKKGKMGKHLNDHVQLCAQALALEEVLLVAAGSIKHGYVFHYGSAKREEVILDEVLRERTLEILREARKVAVQNAPPTPIDNVRKCHDCSLEPICLPREVRMIERGKLRNGDTLSD